MRIKYLAPAQHSDSAGKSQTSSLSIPSQTLYKLSHCASLSIVLVHFFREVCFSSPNAIRVDVDVYAKAWFTEMYDTYRIILSNKLLGTFIPKYIYFNVPAFISS